MDSPVPYRSEVPDGLARDAHKRRAADASRDADQAEQHANKVIGRSQRAQSRYLVGAVLAALAGLGLLAVGGRLPQKATESEVLVFGWCMVGATLCFGAAYFLLAAFGQCRQNIVTGKRLLMRAAARRRSAGLTDSPTDSLTEQDNG